MNKVKSCKLGALLLALSVTTQATNALDLDTFYLDMFAKGQPSAPAAQQNKVRSMIEDRRRDIEDNLSAAKRQGRLTSAQEQDIRARVSYVGTLQTQYMADGVLSNTEASSLFGEESRADKQLQYYLGQANTAPVVTPSTNTSFRTSNGALRNIDRQVRDLDSKLQSAIRSGRLTQAQQDDIKARLAYIGTLQTNYLSDGVLSDADISSLSGEADRADKQLQYYMSNSTVTNPVGGGLPLTTSALSRAGSGALQNVDRGVRDLDSDLRSAMRSRRLTNEQEADIRTRINYVGTQKTSFLSDGVLSDTDLASLNGEIERASKQLNYYLSLRSGAAGAPIGSVTSATIDARIAQLESRLQAAIRANSLGWNDAQQARAEIDNIRQKHRATVHDGTLAPAEEQMLTAMLNNFDTQLSATTGSRYNHWSAFDQCGFSRSGWTDERDRGKHHKSIDSRQQNLKDRIWSGLQSRKLSQREADRLLQSFYRIEALEMQLKSDGKLTGADRKRLNSELDNLSEKLNRELTDRDIF